MTYDLMSHYTVRVYVKIILIKKYLSTLWQLSCSLVNLANHSYSDNVNKNDHRIQKFDINKSIDVL